MRKLPRNAKTLANGSSHRHATGESGQNDAHRYPHTLPYQHRPLLLRKLVIPLLARGGRVLRALGVQRVQRGHVFGAHRVHRAPMRPLCVFSVLVPVVRVMRVGSGGRVRVRGDRVELERVCDAKLPQCHVLWIAADGFIRSSIIQ